MILSQERWYAVQTRPHHEWASEARIARQGFRTFLPAHETEVRIARRTITLLRPFFPSYLFAAFSTAHGLWRSICATRGLAQILAAVEEPHPIPEPTLHPPPPTST